MRPMMVQPHPQQHQQRFFNNDNFNNLNRAKPQHYQPRPNQVQQLQYQQPQHYQQQPQPAANPFIPLQASRKATKAKNISTQKEKTPKEVPSQEVQARPIETGKSNEIAIANTSQIVTPAKVVNNSPAVDNRKSRLAINFGK